MESVYPLLILMAAGYLGFRKTYKQEGSWEKLMQTYAVRISELQTDHKNCEKRYDALEEKYDALFTKYSKLERTAEIQSKSIDHLRIQLETKK